MSPSQKREDAVAMPEFESLPEVPEGLDRRAFVMRSAVMGAAAVLTGCKPAEKEQAAAPKPAPAAAKPAAGL